MNQLFTPENNSRAVLEMPADRPFVFEFFMVESNGFRGMAYRDQECRWYKMQTREQLIGKIVILE